MSKVDAESAKLALKELAEAFGSKDDALLDHVVLGEKEMQPPDLLPVAMEGRLFLREDKVVYVLGKPVKLREGELTELALREPQASDYLLYSKGMVVTANQKDGSVELDSVMMAARTLKTVIRLSGEPLGIVETIKVRDIRTLGEVCQALGFFE